MKTQNKTTVEVKDLAIREVAIPIIGISALVVHKFSEKARIEIEDKQGGQQVKNRKHEARKPLEEYEAAKHVSPLGFEGVPVSAFKKSMVRAAKALGIAMTDARTSFFIEADCKETQLVKINGTSKMRTDMVRLPNGSADVRYRPEYTTWSANLTVSFNEGMVNLNQIFQMVKMAGYGVGICEDRPEKQGGTWGRFKLANEK